MKGNNEYIESRFIEILSICNMSKRSFCEYIGISETNFYRFVNNGFMYSNKMDKIEELGINTLWIIFGEGERFNSRKNGIKLKNKYNKSDDNYNKYFKITTWIYTHYNSINDFEKLFNIKIKKFLRKQDKNSPLPSKLDDILKKDGFNSKWLYHLEESPYLTSKSGREKKNWILNNCQKENYLFKELKKKSNL